MCSEILDNQRETERAERWARRLNTVAMRLARGRPAIDAALGEVFLRLSAGDRLLEVGSSKKSDFANELPGIKPRTFYGLSELARGLRERPILKAAMLAGEVSSVKARIVMKLAVGEDEASWTAAAMGHTVRRLREMVGERGGPGDPSESWGYETLRLAMTPKQQDRLDYALSLAKEFVGYDAPRWKLMAEVDREWLVRMRKLSEDGCTPEELEVRATLDEVRDRKDEIRRQLEAHLEACDFMTEEPGDDENATGLLALAKRLVARRERFDEPLGRVLNKVALFESWRRLGFDSLGEYCREQLGISGSTAKERIRLERRMERLPQLREALKSGRLTYTKTLQVARHATPQDVVERIAKAANTTCQQTKREADAEEDKRDRERGERKVRGPAAALEVVKEAISSSRQFFAARGEEIGAGEAQKRIADYYIDRFEVPLKRDDWRSKWKKDVMLRHGGLCAVPGCTRAAEHVHHIVFQEDGGKDEPFNCLALCEPHHVRCVHGKRLQVRGRGGEHLRWELKNDRLETWQSWETVGLDDVRLRR